MLNFLKKQPETSEVKTPVKKEHYFEDESRIQGAYKDYIVVYQPVKKQFSLVGMLKVDGLNVDTLSVQEQEGLYEDFGVFLSQNVLYEPEITSMNVPVSIEAYIQEWEKTVENYRKLPNHNEKVLQLKASYLYYYKNLVKNMETSKKQHYVINSETIKEQTYDGLEIAYEALKEKNRTIRTALLSFIGKFDCQVEFADISEMKTLLNKYLGA